MKTAAVYVGTQINKERKREVNRVAYWKDEDLVRELEDKLEAYYKDRDIENVN